MDPYLYARYESSLARMITSMDLEDIDVLFEQLTKELSPFYYQEELVAQSRFDERETNFRIWQENMEDKRSFLKKRLAAMKDKLKEVET